MGRPSRTFRDTLREDACFPGLPDRGPCALCRLPDRVVAVGYVPTTGPVVFGKPPPLDWNAARFACRACASGRDPVAVQAELRRLAEVRP